MLVGATARDIALAAEGHDAPLRATNDVDIAVVVADAAAFERLVADLAAVPGGGAHKFLVNGVDVDVVPFGGIEREDRTVIWPDGSTMNTLGFAESLESALELLLPGDVGCGGLDSCPNRIQGLRLGRTWELDRSRRCGPSRPAALLQFRRPA